MWTNECKEWNSLSPNLKLMFKWDSPKKRMKIRRRKQLNRIVKERFGSSWNVRHAADGVCMTAVERIFKNETCTSCMGIEKIKKQKTEKYAHYWNVVLSSMFSVRRQEEKSFIFYFFLPGDTAVTGDGWSGPFNCENVSYAVEFSYNVILCELLSVVIHSTVKMKRRQS